MTGHLVVMTDQVQTAVITDDFMMTRGSCRGALRRRTMIEGNDNGLGRPAQEVGAVTPSRAAGVLAIEDDRNA